jgi:hypothetical protein
MMKKSCRRAGDRRAKQLSGSQMEAGSATLDIRIAGTRGARGRDIGGGHQGKNRGEQHQYNEAHRTTLPN